ncbi:hypothetical protein [Mycobacterium sp.]|uniref:hypothetical protein n=1 Tax=Mycobacterium sp. TaxID=1785 RepID=UPI0026393F3A|nr:hypothetical protein [Mycobacterium sp.]
MSPASNDRSADPLAELLDALLVVVGQTLKYVGLLVWRLLRVVAACPVSMLAVLLTGYVTCCSGWVGGLVVAGFLSLGFAVWRWSMPRSFARYVFMPVRDRAMGWWRYERGWAELRDVHGLTRTVPNGARVPRLRRVHVTSVMDRLEVKLLAGQATADWAVRAEAFRHALGARMVRVSSPRPGCVWLEVFRVDTLAAALPLPAAGGDGQTIGGTETGRPWLLRLLGNHVLIAGATGSGKGSVAWSLLASLAGFEAASCRRR